MAVSLTTITGPVYLPNGATPIRGRVSFELSSWDQEEGEALIISGPVYSTIDENGQFSVELYTSTAGINSVHYRMFVIWEDSELSESYVNDIYVRTPSPHYTKKYIGSFALSGPGPFRVADLTIISETNNSSFDAYLEMKAFVDRIDIGVLDEAIVTTSENRSIVTSLAAQVALDAEQVAANLVAVDAASDAAAGSATGSAASATAAQAAKNETIAAAAFRRATLFALLETTAGEVSVGARIEVPGLGVYERAPDGTPIVNGYPLQGAGVVRWYFISADGTAPVTAFGAVSDNLSDLTPFLTAVTTAGFAAIVPAGGFGWRLNTPFSQPAGSVVRGGTNSRLTIIRKMFNGDAWALGEGAVVEGVHLDDRNNTIGTGGLTGNFTGRGVMALGTESNQRLNGVRITGMDGPCIYFEKDAGSNIKADDVVAVRHNSNLQGRHAVVVENVLASAAIPRHFTNFSSEGLDAIDFGGAANFDVSGSFIGHVEYRANSKRVSILGGRGANATSITVRGDHHAIIGGDYNPQITVASGADANIIMAMSSAPNQWVIDQSGNGRNNIHYHQVTYPATLSAGGGGASLGNGTLIAKTSRTNNLQVIDIELTIGTTTNLGSGAVWFGLPSFAPNWSDMNQPCGWSICQRGGTTIIGTCFLIAGTQFLEIRRDTTGQITFNSPSVWAAGDIMRLKAIYTVG